MRIVSNESCRENQNTYYMFSNCFRMSHHVWDNVEKDGRATKATNDTIIRRMRFACWIPKAADIHSEYVILIKFHCHSGVANAPQYYVYTCISPLVVNITRRDTPHLRNFVLFRPWLSETDATYLKLWSEDNNIYYWNSPLLATISLVKSRQDSCHWLETLCA